MIISDSACVTGIYITPVATDLPTAVAEVTAVRETGLEGDRYFLRRGTWSHWPGGGRQVTLIEAEVVEALQQTMVITAAQLRRNILTRGVKLNDLVGVDFGVGEVVMRGVRRCEPCAHLEKLTVSGIALALNDRGGLRADILCGGMIRPGDKLKLIEATGRSV
ncbi:MAG: sulfurase [Gammaproteobacteria bacterium]|nr:MAG: sulfurase [Gammaproteobacteria bacterium]